MDFRPSDQAWKDTNPHMKDGDPIGFICGQCSYASQETPAACPKCANELGNAMQTDPSKRPTYKPPG